VSILDETMHDATEFVTAVLDWTIRPSAPATAPTHSRHHRG
jgi:hypothetical protein